MLIDTHAHLDMGQFNRDLDAVLVRAAEAGVGHIISVSIDLESLRHNLEIVKDRENLSTSAGIHPNDAAKMSPGDWKKLARLAEDPKVVGIGETGLDFYRDYAPREKQKELFLRHIELARLTGKPLIIHSRDAHDETLGILEKEKAFETGGVMHCFSGDLPTAKRTLDLGFFISIAGPLTYPRSALPEVVREIPADYLLVETDAPYLSPQTRRGKRNEPAYVVETARQLALIKGLSEKDIHRITTFNARALFGLSGGSEAGRIAYPIRDSLYLNVTNRCSNRCVFCRREGKAVVKGHDLRLQREPSVRQVLAAAGDISQYREVVFCGYGEPLLRWEAVREIASALKKKGASIRINTNGQARLFHGHDILPEMAGIVDELSVSLNAPTAEQYEKICRPEDGAWAYQQVKDFIREAKQYVPAVTATVVTLPGVDVEACRRLAVEELGADFRVRTFNEVG